MVYFGAHLRYSDALILKWYPLTSLTNFSSDLDESHNRSLGQVGGRVPPDPPRGYATVWYNKYTGMTDSTVSASSE